MKAWTLVSKDEKNRIHKAVCGVSHVDFSLIFKTQNDAAAYKTLRSLLDKKIVQIEIVGVNNG